MPTEKQIRSKIAKEVKKLSRLKQGKDNVVAGRDQITYGGRIYDESEMVNLVEASLDFWLTEGRFAEKFRDNFAKFLKTKHVVLTNSGSSANLLAVSALTSPLLKRRRLKSGDEVLTTAAGFPTTLNPILQNNLKPVFVDIELDTYNVDVAKLKKAISKKTKAIILPHTMGNPFAATDILKIARRHGLWVIEDCCDALGSVYKGKMAGTFGDLSTFSFYASHHMTMGEGGAICTKDKLLNDILISFRDWGRQDHFVAGKESLNRFTSKNGRLPKGYDKRYIFSHIGYNLKITDLQAAIGVAQLKKLKGFIADRKRNFQRLYKHLAKYNAIFRLPQSVSGAKPCWFGFPIYIREQAPFKRADIVRFLEKKKVTTRMFFGGNLIRQPAYRDMKYRAAGRLVNSDLVAERVFWIGVFPGIQKSHTDYILKVFDEFLKSKKVIPNVNHRG